MCTADKKMDRDNAVGIATRYGLDGLGIESRWRRDFPDRPWGPPSLLYNGYQVLPGPGRGVDHPPPSSVEVEGRVQLYICSPSGPSWPVLGRTSPLPLLPTKRKNFIKFISDCYMFRSQVITYMIQNTNVGGSAIDKGECDKQ